MRRRAVCGDLTSAFSPAAEKDKSSELQFLQRDAFVEEIHRAQFKGLPEGITSSRRKKSNNIRRQLSRLAIVAPPGSRRSAVGCVAVTTHR